MQWPTKLFIILTRFVTDLTKKIGKSPISRIFFQGVLTYLRLYNGNLKEGDIIYNITRGNAEKVSRIAIAYANDYKQVKEASAGDIIVVNGLKETITGDTLVSKAGFAKTHPELR